MISGRREECVFTCYDGCRAGVSSTNVFLIRVYLLLVKVQANCSVPVLAPGERFLRTRPLPLLGALQAAPLLGATGGGGWGGGSGRRRRTKGGGFSSARCLLLESPVQVCAQ